MDASCLPALIRVTTAVLELGQRVAAGDEDAAKQLSVLATMLNAEPEVWGDSAAREMRGKPTGYTSYWCSECDHDRDYGHIGGRLEGCPTVRAIAAIWSGHPDYRAEWKP